MDRWVCLAVSTSFHHGDKSAVALEVKRIFGNDLVETRTVCDSILEESGEYFILVKCSDYQPHAEALKESAAVLRVVPSYAEPAFLSETEVNNFAKSVKDEEKPASCEFICGDIVRVKDVVVPSDIQYIFGLYGVVVGYGRWPKWYRIFFRLETKSFEMVICSTSLEYMGNVLEGISIRPFKHIVKRVDLFSNSGRTKAQEAMENLVNCDKIRRKQRREHEGPYNCH